MSHTTLIMTCYCLYLFIMNYGLILWGNSLYSCNVFRLQNGVARIIMRCRTRDSIQEIKNFAPKSQYIFHLLLFVVNNKAQFIVNSETYSINTIQLPISIDLRQIWLYIYIYIYIKMEFTTLLLKSL